MSYIVKTSTLIILSFLLSLFFAWHTLSTVNFGYGFLYDSLEINQTIEEFGPKNKFKQNFELTTEEDHKRIFKEIVEAVNAHGKDLRGISYHDPKLKQDTPLLHDAEVIHLQDVANLIYNLNNINAFVAFFFVTLLTLLYRHGEHSFPSLLTSMGATVGVCVFATLVIIIIGAEDVFYKWHTLVFPDNHQWFFYYYESLMTTLMKAPDIFAYIAVFLLFTTLAYHMILLSFIRFVFTSELQRSNSD